MSDPSRELFRRARESREVINDRLAIEAEAREEEGGVSQHDQDEEVDDDWGPLADPRAGGDARDNERDEARVDRDGD